MSNPPDPTPYDSPPIWDYQSPPQDNAAKLVRLAVIFNYISVGLDALLALGGIGFGILFSVLPDALPRNESDPPAWVLSLIYIGMGAMATVLGIVKLFGTRKLQTAAPNAWGWGLTTGIVGCAQFLCGSCCCLQVAAGIYTLVIINMQTVRHYLATQAAGANTPDPNAPNSPPPAF